MYSKKTTVINESGLHARPASDFVGEASKFKKTKITLKRVSDGSSCNAKSIVMVLDLYLKKGEEVEVIGEGEDEAKCVDSLIALIDSGLGE